MRSPRTACAFVRSPSVAFALALSLIACGGEEITPAPVPSADDARDFFGLTTGSCIRYRFTENNFTLFGVAEISAPNTIAVAGRTVFERTFIRNVGTGDLEKSFFESRDGGEIRLARSERDQSPTRIYPADSQPLFIDLDFDNEGNVTLRPDQRFAVTTTPMVTGGTAEAERHTMVVDPMPTPIEVPRESGMVDSIGLQYTVETGPRSESVLFRLVPGRGIARIIEATRTYTACDWRTCDRQGMCTGAASCQQLSCN